MNNAIGNMTNDGASLNSSPNTNINGLGVSLKDAIAVGERLHKARLQRGCDILFLAGKIKIREHYAAAMESGAWNDLPPGVNGRGLIRIYAKELGVSLPELDSKTTVQSSASYEEAIPAFAVIQRSSLAGKNLSEASLDLARSIPRASTQSSKILDWQADEAPIASQDVMGMLGLAQYFDETSQDVPKVTAESVADQMFSTSEDQNPGITAPPPVAASLPLDRIPLPSKVLAVDPPKTEIINSGAVHTAHQVAADSAISQTPQISAMNLAKTEDAPQKSTKWWIATACAVFGIAAAAMLVVYQKPSAGTTAGSTPAEEPPVDSASAEIPMEVGAVSLEPVAAIPAPIAQPENVAPKNSLGSESGPDVAVEPVVVVPDVAAGKRNTAELKFSAPVQISLTVDGKKLFDGTSTAVSLPFAFEKTAEIMVSDGSLVSLKFGTWDHGPLGHEGRKRKITLYPENF